jgi:hypothetical protein
MHDIPCRSTLLILILAGCEPKADSDDEVGDTTSDESDSSGTETETTTSDTETSTSDSETTTSDTETTTSDTETETETGDPEPFELIPANADWFVSNWVIAHRRLGDDEQLLLGGYTGDLASSDAGVLAIDLDGTTRWKSLEPWMMDRVHAVIDLEPLAEGGTWLTGGTYDRQTLGDGPGWIWIAKLDFAGAWSFLIDTPYGNLPDATTVRPDGSAVILQSSFGGYGLHDFSAAGEHQWALSNWGTVDQYAQELVAVPGGVVVGGVEDVGGALDENEEQWPWFRRISDAGELLDEAVHPGPAGAHENVTVMRFDETALTVEVLVQRGLGQYEARWLTLDVDDLSLISARELGQGSPRELELDGSGGAWIVIIGEDGSGEEGSALHHFDAAGSSTWMTAIAEWEDIAFDREGARAYVLRQDLTGIDVVPL